MAYSPKERKAVHIEYFSGFSLCSLKGTVTPSGNTLPSRLSFFIWVYQNERGRGGRSWRYIYLPSLSLQHYILRSYWSEPILFPPCLANIGDEPTLYTNLRRLRR